MEAPVSAPTRDGAARVARRARTETAMFAHGSQRPQQVGLMLWWCSSWVQEWLVTGEARQLAQAVPRLGTYSEGGRPVRPACRAIKHCGSDLSHDSDWHRLGRSPVTFPIRHLRAEGGPIIRCCSGAGARHLGSWGEANPLPVGLITGCLRIRPLGLLTRAATMTAGPRSPGAVAILVGRRGSRCFILLISLNFRGGGF